MNPEESFIALRLFNQAIAPSIYFWQCANFLKNVLAIHERSPDLIEWEEVDKLFTYWFHEIYRRAYVTLNVSSKLLQCILRYGV